MSEGTALSDENWDEGFSLPAPRSNRRLTLAKRVEAFLFLGLLRILRRCSIEKASGAVGRTMRVVGPMLRPIQKRGLANLKLIYPEMAQIERQAILRDAWENVGRTAAEYAHFDKLADRVTIERGEIMEKIAAENRQAIFVSGHFGNWEALGTILRRAGIRFAMVYRAPNNRLVDEHIIGLRGAHISRLQIPKGKRGGRDLLNALKEGYSLSMLVDQKLNDGIEVPLLGYPAMTPPAAARLARKLNLPIIPLQMTRRPGAHFLVTVHDPIEPGDRTVEELTTRINAILGDFILARPDQWLWFHRRWPAELTPID
ncbi:MAG: lysophospholipid acyltransferase family protein [Parvularcula sp.]|nr:lysophospholipid acyltransferase family protein [Parvularcula sp.]